MQFLISKCKSNLCNKPRPKPTAAPTVACLLLCLPPSACTISTRDPSALHLLLSAFHCFPATLGVTSERSHHSARCSRDICSRFGVDSCPVSPHLQSRHLGAALPVLSWSQISESNFHMKALIKAVVSPPFFCFQAEDTLKVLRFLKMFPTSR